MGERLSFLLVYILTVADEKSFDDTMSIRRSRLGAIRSRIHEMVSHVVCGLDYPAQYMYNHIFTAAEDPSTNEVLAPMALCDTPKGVLVDFIASLPGRTLLIANTSLVHALGLPEACSNELYEVRVRGGEITPEDITQFLLQDEAVLEEAGEAPFERS